MKPRKPGGRVNAKGRNSNIPFIRLHRGITQSAAWQALHCRERCLLLAIWERHNGSNNGQIAFSFRDGMNAMKAGDKTTRRAFRNLQEKGFLILIQGGSFGYKIRHASVWEITVEPVGDHPAKNLYRDWKENPGTSNSDDQ